MKTTLATLILTLVALTGCGGAEDPSGPPGICYRLETRDGEERLPDTVLWRECIRIENGICSVNRPFGEVPEQYCVTETEFEADCYEGVSRGSD